MEPYDILYTALYINLTNSTENGNVSFYVVAQRAIILFDYEF